MSDDNARAEQIGKLQAEFLKLAREATEPADPERMRGILDAIGSVSRAWSRELAPNAGPFGEWRTLAEAGVTFADPPPRRAWLLTIDGEGALPLGKCGVLAAGGGTGKTMALVQLALAVATGRPWLDRFQVARPGRVLLALAEEDLEEVTRRLYRAACAMDLDRAQRAEAAARIVALPLAGTPCALTLKDKQGNTNEAPALAALRERMSESEWSLVLLDPLSRWAGDDTEIDNAAATRFVQAVETLVSAPGSPAVLVAHHSSKSSAASGAANVRGASGIVDGFRWAATMDKIDAGDVTGVRLHLAKTNYTRAWDDVFLTWASTETGHEKGAEGALVLANDATRAKLKDAAATSDGGADAETRRKNAEARSRNAETKAQAEARRTREADERAARKRATGRAIPPPSGELVEVEIPGVGPKGEA